MAQNRKTENNTEAICSLADAVRKIPRPHNFYSGINLDPLVIPHDVIIFRGKGMKNIPQSHDRCMFVVCLQVQGTIMLDGEDFVMHPGEALLIPPYAVHSYCDFPQQSDNVWLYITFTVDSVASLWTLMRSRFLLLAEERIQLDKLMHTYMDVLKTNRIYEEKTFVLKFTLFLNELCENHEREETANAPSLESMIFMQKIGFYVDAHITEKITLDMLAKHMSMSVSNLRRVARLHMNMSLGRWVKRLRIHHAGMLLIDTNMTITQIGEACGYDTPYIFSHAFKNALGLSPRAYRQCPPNEYPEYK